ncbi:MAG: hypothetical protein ACFFDN_51230 [Candidatus Hodarchaeota archaeon]
MKKEENVPYSWARNSLYPTDKNKLSGHWYGPLKLSVSLSNILFSSLLNGDYKYISNEEVLNNIAYSNCVRCAYPFAVSDKPTETMKINCKIFTEEEISILKPDFVFCIGRDPFYQIQSIFNAEHVIHDFFYRIQHQDRIIRVIYFYHYGIQQSINAAAKILQLFTHLSDNAKSFQDEIEKELQCYTSNIWRQKYSKIAKYYSIQMINLALKDFTSN